MLKGVVDTLNRLNFDSNYSAGVEGVDHLIGALAPLTESARRHSHTRMLASRCSRARLYERRAAPRRAAGAGVRKRKAPCARRGAAESLAHYIALYIYNIMCVCVYI